MRARLATHLALNPRRLSTPAARRLASTTTHAQHPTLLDEHGRLLSRVSGPTDTPLSSHTLGRFWDSLVGKHADRPALIVRHEPQQQHGDLAQGAGDACIRWTYEQMDSHVRRLVRGMRRLGIKRGDRVAVLMMNNSAMASLQIATSLLGAVLVTLNPSYTHKELSRSLNHSGASSLFIVPSLRSSDYLEKLTTILPSLASPLGSRGDPTELADEACPLLKRIILVDNLSARPQGWESHSVLAREGKGYQFALQRIQGRAIDYRDMLQANDEGAAHGSEEPGLTCHDVINLQFTSGTTGSPKAVALTSHNLVNNGIMLGQVMHLTPADILANIPPLFHCFGLTLGNLAAWSCGAAILYSAEGFDPVRALRAASEDKATAIHGVPAHFIAELAVLRQVLQARKTGKWDNVERLGVRRDEAWDFVLRTGFTSGSTVPIELMHAIMDDNLLGAKEQTTVYGMTETSPVSFACDTKAAVKLRCETVGRVMPHVHAKVVAPDDPLGKPLPVGEVGELCSGGYIVMDGYWNDRARTDEVLQVHPDEPDITWMRTGDLAAINKDGYAEIRGRVKDLIIRGGENLTAVNIEK